MGTDILIFLFCHLPFPGNSKQGSSGKSHSMLVTDSLLTMRTQLRWNFVGSGHGWHTANSLTRGKISVLSLGSSQSHKPVFANGIRFLHCVGHKYPFVTDSQSGLTNPVIWSSLAENFLNCDALKSAVGSTAAGHRAVMCAGENWGFRGTAWCLLVSQDCSPCSIEVHSRKHSLKLRSHVLHNLKCLETHRCFRLDITSFLLVPTEP